MLPVASPLFAAVGFDLGDGIAIDWMHIICLGIVRDLLDKWLNSSSEPYFIGDEVLLLIC
jgi:hypothetical protein